jgi:phosphohistidine phosphatase SixA
MLFAIASLALFPSLPVAPPDELRGEALMQALQRGGYTVVLRHARTDRSFQEEIATVPRLRSQQRNLSDEGVREARVMAVVFGKYRIPFSEVVSSPMFRTLETADYAGHTATDTTMVLRTFPAVDAQRVLIGVEPKPGTNRLLVTHHFVIEAHVPGIRPGDIGESEAAVVRPTGGGRFELVGRILVADWATLSGGAATPAAPSPAAHGAPGTGTPIVHATGPMRWPHGDMGRLARGYVSAFNSGDTTTMRQFLETEMTSGTLPMPTRIATYQRLFETYGPLTVTTLDSSTDVEVKLLAMARQSSIRMIMRRVDASATRLTSVSFQIQAERQ